MGGNGSFLVVLGFGVSFMTLSYLVPLLSALLVCMSVYLLMLKRSMQKNMRDNEALINSFSTEVQGVSHGAMGVGRKVLNIEKQLLSLKNSFEEMKSNDPAKVSYSEASRLVELGAGVEDLMNTCGISRPEAELVSALTESKKKQEYVPVLTAEA
jgi:hypothetical protein